MSNNQENGNNRVKSCRDFLEFEERLHSSGFHHIAVSGEAKWLTYLWKRELEFFKSRDLLLHSAKLEIKRIFRRSFLNAAAQVSRNKSWSSLCGAHCVPNLPRIAVEAVFILLTERDCHRAYLFRFILTNSPVRNVCESGQDKT